MYVFVCLFDSIWNLCLCKQICFSFQIDWFFFDQPTMQRQFCRLSNVTLVECFCVCDHFLRFIFQIWKCGEHSEFPFFHSMLEEDKKCVAAKNCVACLLTKADFVTLNSVEIMQRRKENFQQKLFSPQLFVIWNRGIFRALWTKTRRSIPRIELCLYGHRHIYSVYNQKYMYLLSVLKHDSHTHRQHRHSHMNGNKIPIWHTPHNNPHHTPQRWTFLTGHELPLFSVQTEKNFAFLKPPWNTNMYLMNKRFPPFVKSRNFCFSLSCSSFLFFCVEAPTTNPAHLCHAHRTIYSYRNSMYLSVLLLLLLWWTLNNAYRNCTNIAKWESDAEMTSSYRHTVASRIHTRKYMGQMHNLLCNVSSYNVMYIRMMKGCECWMNFHCGFPTAAGRMSALLLLREALNLIVWKSTRTNTICLYYFGRNKNKTFENKREFDEFLLWERGFAINSLWDYLYASVLCVVCVLQTHARVPDVECVGERWAFNRGREAAWILCMCHVET